MEATVLEDATKLIEKANADLQPELLRAEDAHVLLGAYARIEKLAAFGKAVLARKVDDADRLARITGTSLGKAKQTVETAKALAGAPETSEALSRGSVSLDQAAEIARAEQACPGSAADLLGLAEEQPFHALGDKARKVVLEAEQHKDLGERQRAGKSARSFCDELGMVNVHLPSSPMWAPPSSPGPRRRRRASTGRQSRTE